MRRHSCRRFYIIDSPGRRFRRNNPSERIIRELRLLSRVVGVFSDGDSALMLVGARLGHIAGVKWGARRYLSMEHLTQNVSAETSVA